MTFAGNAIKATEGVTLSGISKEMRLQADRTLEKLIKLSAEGAKRIPLISQAKGQSATEDRAVALWQVFGVFF